ncbi:hypothetical protein HDU81_005463 [Chytriomyces hyalinus]|nr:hypothetical protein HDU81_005463 [Chytriomyces hyalinus]
MNADPRQRQVPSVQTPPPESRSNSVSSSHNALYDMAAHLGDTIEDGVTNTFKATMSAGESFAAFISRGSVVDLAIGIVVGGAFTTIVDSFVNDLISPVIGMATQKNLNNLFLVISCSDNSTHGCLTGYGHNYTTVLQATTDGAATWNYGNFVTHVFNFLLTSFIMFLLVQLYSNAFLKVITPPEAAKTKPCPCCIEECHILATKCRYCHSLFPMSKPSAPLINY